MSLPEKLRHFALRSEDQEAAVMREAADEIDRLEREARNPLILGPEPDQLDVPIGELRAYVPDPVERDEEMIALLRDHDMWMERALTMQRVAQHWIDHAKALDPDLFLTRGPE